MIVSTWRYGHFILAVSSFLFLLIVALTGLILAIEPIEERFNSPIAEDLSAVSLADLVETVQAKHEEIFFIRKESNGLIKVAAFDHGSSQEYYIHPVTTERIEELFDPKPIYQFAISLHRSLFLGTVGRIFVGINSLVLLLLCISGVFLIARKQGSWKKFFKRIERTRSIHYYHTALGRLFLLPIAFLALTGIYLSLNRFIDFSSYKVSHQVNDEKLKELPKKQVHTFPVFQNVSLDDLKEIEFPFSDDPEDLFTVKLEKSELLINQYTGETISEYEYPMLALISNLVKVLHTGDGNIMLAIINGISSLSIVAFIFTGLIISLKSRSKKVKKPFQVSDCNYIILYGSENGSTEKFANAFFTELLKAGKKCYITTLNEFQYFQKLEHLIIFTSTYGQGEAPGNAASFQKRLVEFSQLYTSKFSYSIVGFGSKSYSDYCKYAFDLNLILEQSSIGLESIPIHTINNQNISELNNWMSAWSEKNNINPSVRLVPDTLSKTRISKFKILEKFDSPNKLDDTFILRISNGKQDIQSGDLLGIYPPGEERERYYSLGQVNNHTESGSLLLSVKKHSGGVCSNYLNGLSPGDLISGFLVANEKFHKPRDAKKVIMICNGTGIAPFLGMVNENHTNCKKYLYWGGQNRSSFELYENFLRDSLNNGSLKKVAIALSRSDNRSIYIQEIIKQDGKFITEILAEGGVVMICGSNAMLREVKLELSAAITKDLKLTLQHFEDCRQLLYDCY